ncbi:MAG: hypothetical protein IJI57_15770 [Flexilinea sp.]|nr:hypothetical protein [Flexilinea sp.]
MEQNRPASKQEKFSGSSIFRLISIFFLLACLAGAVSYIRFRADYTLNTDDASEFALGKFLSEEGSLVSKNWYYSTELSVVNTNLIYPFVFRLSDSWHRVRVISTVVIYLIMLAVYFGLSRAYRFKKYFALTAALLFIPFSETFYHFVIKGLFYYPYFTILFLVLMLSEFYIRQDGRKAFLMLTVSALFSLFVGFGGARMLFHLYIPLLAASGLLMLGKEPGRKQTRWFVFSLTVFVFNCIGFLVNFTVLAKIYHFDAWEKVAFINFDITRISGAFSGIMQTFGYTPGNFFSPAFLFNLACGGWLLLTAYALYYALRNREKVSGEYFRFSLFTFLAFVIYIVYYGLTDSYFNTRYCLSLVVLAFPASALFAEQADLRKNLSGILLGSVVLLTALSGLLYYRTGWTNDENEDLRKACDTLVTEGYHNGYASFWWTNVLTELSNGKIEVWNVVNDFNDQGFYRVKDIDEMYHFLQPVSHDTTHPSGKVFIFFTAGEFENNNWKAQLEEAKILHRSDEFVAVGFDSYEAMIDCLYPGYDFVFEDGSWLEKGVDLDGKRLLAPGGISSGPYQTFWPGTYDVVISGVNLDSTEVTCQAENGERMLAMENLSRNDEEVRFTFRLDQKMRGVETVVINVSEETDHVVTIDRISIRKRIEDR